jgi:KamA family protein
VKIEKYQAVTRQNVERTPEWASAPRDLREAVQVVSQVLPFRTNRYVMRELIDWSNLPDDPIFQLVFPQREMLDPEDYEQVRRILQRRGSREAMARAVARIRKRLNPHPAGQLTDNVPINDHRPLPGMQHKYEQTLLFFPSQGQTCHAYCTYCFRWAQFVGTPDLKFESSEAAELTQYLGVNRQVTDVLFTGGDPMIMKTAVLRRYVEPVLGVDSVRNNRIGTKSLAWWPQRFVTDDDADDMLRLLEEIVASGRQMAFMAHFSHPAELSTPIVREAIRRIRATGAQIRMQAPLVAHVNDHANLWVDLWTEGTQQGMIPYYLFVERDTGPKRYFEIPLARAYRIFRDAYRQLSGLARTVRGPSMSAHPGKVRVAGIQEIHGERVFVLEFLQARNPEWVLEPFFARYDEKATWLTDLVPAFGEKRFFFEDAPEAKELTA